MSDKVVWDKVGERRYETGVDRGVLFLPDNTVVPWNGLIGVTDNASRDFTPYYLHGMVYMQHSAQEPYSGKLTAFTYPQELEERLGVVEANPGVRVHDQTPKPFSLSYRTKVGSDVTNGPDLAYKLHIIFNFIATPSDIAFESLGAATAAPTPFEWNLVSVPERLSGGLRPTSHLSFDSLRMDPTKLATLETQIYGNDSQAPSLPSLEATLALAIGG
jgi:hypothetical protein